MEASKQKRDELLSKYQQGETVTVNRSELKEAVYNPRNISESALNRLKKSIQEHGLIGATIVWNRQTGTVVSGHQRLKALDILENGNDYELQVTAIDVPLREEKALNVQLNNLSMQGEWDNDKLADLIENEDFDPAELGFTDLDIDYLFGGDDRFSALYQNDDVKATKEELKEIKKNRKEAMQRYKEEQSPDYYVTVVCESQEDKDTLMKEIGMPVYEKYVSSGQIRRLKRKTAESDEARQ